jgi:hypothetical protein
VAEVEFQGLHGVVGYAPDPAHRTITNRRNTKDPSPGSSHNIPNVVVAHSTLATEAIRPLGAVVDPGMTGSFVIPPNSRLPLKQFNATGKQRAGIIRTYLSESVPHVAPEVAQENFIVSNPAAVQVDAGVAPHIQATSISGVWRAPRPAAATPPPAEIPEPAPVKVYYEVPGAGKIPAAYSDVEFQEDTGFIWVTYDLRNGETYAPTAVAGQEPKELKMILPGGDVVTVIPTLVARTHKHLRHVMLAAVNEV